MTPKVDSLRVQPATVWRANGLRPWRLAGEVFAGIEKHEFAGRASALAFDFLFALFPLIFLMLTLFGLFASRSTELQNDFLSYFADFLPPAAFSLLGATAKELAVNASAGKLTFGFVAALWFGSGGVSSMISALHLSFGVAEERSWVRVRAIAIAVTMMISALTLMALLLVLVSGDAIDWVAAELGLQPVVVLLWKIFQWPTAISFVMLSHAVIYYCGPDPHSRRWHWILPGAAFGTGLWLLASLGFRAYLHFYNTYSASYGSLGAVMILLVWLYVAGFAFLIGGEINAQLERAAMPAARMDQRG
jgi:membrane protein